MTIEPVSGASPVRVPDDLPCGTCGYNLRTLDWDGNCSECGRPVRESRLLPGFRFSGLRAARRLQFVLVLLVVATLVAVLIDIWLTYVFLTWSRTVSRARMIVPSYFWMHASTIVALFQFTVICLLRRLSGSCAPGVPSRLPRVMLGVGVVDLLLHLVFSAADRPFSAGMVGWLGRVVPVIEPTRVVSSLLAGILVWICLLRLADRGSWRPFWQGTAVVVGLLVLVKLSQVLLRVLFVGFQLSGYSSWDKGTEPWWVRLGSLWEPCQKYVGGPCSILLMMIVWAYMRRLGAAVRQTRCADLGRGGD